MSVRLRTIAAALLTLALMVSCTAVPGRNAPSTNVQPSYLCTGGSQAATPFPCDKARNDEQQKTKELEDQAKAVYERYWKEYTRLLQAGGATEATPELKATVAEPALANVVALLRYQAEKGWTPNPLVASQRSRLLSTPVRPDAEVSLAVCEDARGTVLVDRSGQIAGRGVLAVQNLALKRLDGAMRIYDSTSEGVTTCPFDS